MVLLIVKEYFGSPGSAVVERLALRAVAPRRAARRLRTPAADNGLGRPLCAGGVVAARPLPPHGRLVAARRVPPRKSPLSKLFRNVLIRTREKMSSGYVVVRA